MKETVIRLLGSGPLDEVALLSRMEAAAEEAAESSGEGVDLSGFPCLLWQMVEEQTLSADLPEGCRDALTEPMIYRVNESTTQET